MNKWTKILGGTLLAAVMMVSVAGTALAQTMPASSAEPILAIAPLSEQEASGLAFMREEEKLARDVYLALYDEWNLAVFKQIASSEQTHMNSIAMLLDRYGVADPAEGNAAGEFTDPTLQALYTDLVAQGSESLTAALQVGAAIEEIDIADLQERMALTTHADIEWVYSRLNSGSENHLRAFVSNLGGDYAPQYLDQASYDAILAARSSMNGGPSAYNQSGRAISQRGYGQRGALRR